MHQPRRIAIIGNTGSGKSTLAARVADRLNCRHVEIDALYHQENWTPLDRDELRRIVSAAIAAPAWVLDGNYASLVGDLVFAAADTVVWLDLPRRVVMPRLARRTLGRMLLRRELWNGNREQWRNLISTDPEQNILLWSWTRHAHYRARYSAAMADPGNAHLEWIRLRTPAAIASWAASVDSR